MGSVPKSGLRYDQRATTVQPAANPILLYDGVCGLCNQFVQFMLRHDRRDIFRFASLQGSLAARVLERHGASAATLDTFYVVVDPEQNSERLFSRSEAVAYVLRELGGGWRLLSFIWKVLPLALRDAAYNLVARNRYRIFGKLDTCPLPDPRERHKFLDN
jgi:predicted DCC family thiol-disulfide oxidoreductase YuxK